MVVNTCIRCAFWQHGRCWYNPITRQGTTPGCDHWQRADDVMHDAESA